MSKSVVFIDAEISIDDQKIRDLGAVKDDQTCFHSASIQDFISFISGTEFICGHNIVHHDLKYIRAASEIALPSNAIDTLYLSPLLFPKHPYHALLKNDKLQVEELNNPVNDCKKAANLFYDEINAFSELPSTLKQIFCSLLYNHPEFTGFFEYVNYKPNNSNLPNLIRDEYAGKICVNAELAPLIRNNSIELAYALALIAVDDSHSITPPWLLRNYPKIENVIRNLRNTPCAERCEYCEKNLDIHR